MHAYEEMIDNVSIFMGVLFPITTFLAFGLEIPHFRDTVLPALLTNFGLTPPKTDLEFGSGLISIFAGCFALPDASVNITALFGHQESDEIKECRQFHNLLCWAGWAIGFGLWTLKGNQGGYFGCPFNSFWNLVFVFMTIMHVKFLGGPKEVAKKLKHH